MATRPTNSPRGLWAASKLRIGSGGVIHTAYANTTALMTANSTGLLVAGQVRVSGQKYIGANTTGFIFTAAAAKPSTRTAGFNWTFITNSTGVSGICVRTTGTTWKFLNVTSVIPT